MENRNRRFFEDVYFVVRKIPYGRVSSYGSIAKYIGSPQSSRVVGWAMNNSHNLKNFPAHRVVNRNGLLTGKNHFIGTNLMEQLLKNEGILIKNDQIINFDDFFWDPSNEL